jgi:hypothetical protein
MAASESTTDIGAVKLAVGLYLVLFAIKLAAYVATGVMALLAESFHIRQSRPVAGGNCRLNGRGRGTAGRTFTRRPTARAQIVSLINDQLGLLAALAGTPFVARG